MSHPSSSLLSALLSLRSTPPRIIQSPPTQPRRASVALVLRLKPPVGLDIPEEEWGVGMSLEEFFNLPWVNHPETTPQLLFIRRTTRPSDRFSSHIAFPGGRSEPTDTSHLYTVLRETWEEIGVDLDEREFVNVARLDDREITTSLGKRLLMILSPFVFLQLTPHSPPPDLQPSEIASLHWIDLSRLSPPANTSIAAKKEHKENWGHVEIDISSRLSPRNKLVRVLLRGLVGGMKFTSLLLPDEPDCISPEYAPEFEEVHKDGSGTIVGKNGQRKLRLWGLTLGMTLDLLSHLPQQEHSPSMSTRSLQSEEDFTEKSRLLSHDRSHSTSGFSNSLGLVASKTPKTPVTVPSTFDETFGTGSSVTSPVERSDSKAVGSRVDLKVLETEAQAGVKKQQQQQIGRGGNRRGVGPGITAVFPKFSYPDVNLFIWLFSRKYRRLLRQWEESTRGPASASARRVNWSGAALSAFYSAVRHALVVAIVVRALTTISALGTASWYLWKWYVATR